MKTVLMALMGFFLITTVRGQSPSLGSGLYRSVEDFRNNHRFYDLLDAQIQTVTQPENRSNANPDK